MAYITTGAGDQPYNNIAKAISAYTQQARTDAALISSTGILGSDARITDAGEGFTGTLRWLNYSGAPQDSSLDAGDSSTADMGINNKSEVYVKNARNITASELSIQRLISKQDALSYMGAQFGTLQARDTDAQLRSMLKLVASKVVAADTATDITATGKIPNATTNGVELGYFVNGALFANGTTTFAHTTSADLLLDAVQSVHTDQERAFYYMIVDSETYNTLRKNNRLDTDRITDGNIQVPTMFGGKFRVITTENASSMNVAYGTATKTTYLVDPGSVHFSPIAQINPTAVERDEKVGRSTGGVRIFSRWGNIMHVKGLSWNKGTVADFPRHSETDVDAGNNEYGLFNAANWDLNAANVNEIGVLPIFHS